MVCESHLDLEARKGLLLLALEIGFHHISPESSWMEANLTHKESHQKMVDIIFQSGESEAIADLLCAWTSVSLSHGPHPSLKICAEYLVGLSHLQPFSPKLHQLVIRSIQLIGYQGFNQIGVEGFVGLLDGLHVCIENIFGFWGVRDFLLDIVQSPEGIQYVSHQNLGFLVEEVVLSPQTPEDVIVTYSPHIMISLEDAKEWDKLECWMGIIWIMWSRGGKMDEGLETDEELERVTLSLFQQ